MNLLDILAEGNRTLIPKALLSVYENYIEVASIEHDKIGAFSPLTKEALINLVELSAPNVSKMSVGGLIPKNVLYVSYSVSNVVIVFKINSCKKKVIVSDGTIEKVIPNLLMVITGNHLNVYSYRSTLNKRTVLYKAPFSNQTGKTSVCFGNVKIKQSNVLDEIVKNFEDAYWNSTFEMSKKRFRELLENNWDSINKATYYEKLIKSL